MGETAHSGLSRFGAAGHLLGGRLQWITSRGNYGPPATPADWMSACAHATQLLASTLRDRSLMRFGGMSVVLAVAVTFPAQVLMEALGHQHGGQRTHTPGKRWSVARRS
ncbi:hypothetical protein Arub01_28800 [Actinomadura rubrobrunea]|uniref:Uncharacterized protein n=1 Tax=Actinomadura rubrobrunea TaxID=115335 RepID=A0A9W6UUH4_9ACTN|nr:hypothetical protein Arub01_28800 [Actinomadura rubrobrunea]